MILKLNYMQNILDLTFCKPSISSRGYFTEVIEMRLIKLFALAFILASCGGKEASTPEEIDPMGFTTRIAILPPV